MIFFLGDRHLYDTLNLLFIHLINKYLLTTYHRASLVGQLVKNLPAMPETWVRSLGWEDPLEQGKAIHSSILAWRITWAV